MSDEHDHTHAHDELALRAAALEAVLVEKGLLSTDQVDAIVERYERDLGPQNGARVVARAWVDTAYRERLLADGARAIGELGYGGFEGGTMIAVENTPATTMSSSARCARATRGPSSACRRPGTRAPPTAHGSSPSHAPCCAEFGLELPAEKEIRVWDSTSEVRYLVVHRASRRDRGDERGAARSLRHPRQHDRHGSRREPFRVSSVDPDVASPEAPGSAAAVERRARLRRAVGEPRLRPRGRASRRRRRGLRILPCAPDRGDRHVGERCTAQRGTAIGTTSGGSPRWSERWSPSGSSIRPRSTRRATRSSTSGTTTTDRPRRARGVAPRTRPPRVLRPGRRSARPAPRRGPAKSRSRALREPRSPPAPGRLPCRERSAAARPGAQSAVRRQDKVLGVDLTRIPSQISATT